MTGRGLYELAASCPDCQRRPRLKLYPRALKRFDDMEPDESVMSYRCHVCRHSIYPLAAVAFQRAQLVEQSDPAA